MKRIMIALTFSLLGSLWAANSVVAQDDLVGKEVYTLVNVWFEKPKKILATNYHVGGILGVGTKVKIVKANHKLIAFTDDTGTQYRIVQVPKHNNVATEELAQRLFSDTDPKAPGGKYSQFSKEDQEMIDAGILREGMSEDAVLMAYGYPPTIRTPNLEQPMWTYWRNRWVTQTVRFKDGKVVELKGF